NLGEMVIAAAHAGDMGDTYLAANLAIGKTVGADGDFGSRESTEGDTYDPVSLWWRTLRDQLQAILGQTYFNLKDTETALRLTAAEYASTDDAAAEKLNETLDDYNAASDDELGRIDEPSLDEDGGSSKPVLPGSDLR